jgi:hypothetical protein
MQQRAIRPEALDLLFEFGREAFDHHGAVVLYFDKAARQRLLRSDPGAKEVERLARCYAVLSTEGEVLTVGHRHRKINRD